MHGLAEWEELRRLASFIKERMLTHLDEYLNQFEANARERHPRSLGQGCGRPQPHPAGQARQR